MTKTQHTPALRSVSQTPWRLDDTFSCVVRNCDSNIVTITERRGSREADAARIVECVNECDGIDDPSDITRALALLSVIVFRHGDSLPYECYTRGHDLLARLGIQ